MRETQINIKKYKDDLSKVKEKIFSAAILFVISAAMLTTTSFAWIVLSTAPQVSNISSTIVGNGSLEIALVGSDENGELLQPNVSQVGDSTLDLVSRNKTWGNLINLNDPSYGLNSLTLKPARLNPDDLLNQPLQAVEYGADGRVTYPLKNFAYSNYDPTADNGNGAFVIKDVTSYGVRAISSTKDATLQDAEDIEKIKIINESLEQAKTKYEILVSTDTKVNPNGYIKVVSDLMGLYLTDRFNDGDENYGSYMKTMYALMSDFRDVLYLTAGTYGYIANVQLMEDNPNNIAAFTVETLLNTNESELKKNGIQLMTGFDSLVSDIKALESHMNTIKTLRDEYEAKTRSTVIWNDIKNAVVFIVDIDNCIVSIPNANLEYKVSQVGKDEALGLVSNKSKGVYGIITSGALKRCEQLIGKKMRAENLTITAKYIISMNIEGVTVYTDSKAPYTIEKLINNVNAYLSGSNVAKVAADAYGFALDFWVRTNIPNSYLTLEGKAQIELQPKKTSKGYNVYTTKDGYLVYHEPNGNISDPSSDLLKKLQSGEEDFKNHNSHLLTGNLYYYSTGTIMEFLDPTTEKEDPVLRENYIIENITGYSINTQVIGYDGVNRVWQEGVELEDSATQGQGSCFIFYSEDPLYEEQMLQLLKSFTVVFVDEEGNKLETAYLNTEHAYSNLGKVIVPLELDESAVVVKNEKDEDIKIISALKDSVSTFVTAIVYIDGTKVNNEDVDAINDINGYLNIQFGSSSSLDNYEDNSLKSNVIIAEAEVENNNFEFTAGTLPSTPLTVKVTGINPATVTARFMRMLNNSQVALEDYITLSPQDDGTFKTNVTFDRPGTYVLRTVWIDGIEYELTAPVTITVTGFAIDSVVWKFAEAEVYYMTSQKTMSSYYDLSFSGTYVPETVQGVIRTDNGNQTIDFRRTNGGRWSTDVIFDKSGRYELDTLIIDGDVYILPDSMKKILTLHLGVHATVNISGETTVTYDPTKTYTYGMSVSILDGNNKVMSSLSNVELMYASQSVLDVKPIELKWNSASQTYKGNLNLSFPGIYSYNYLSINGNVIESGSGSNITIIPPEEPEYVDDSAVNLNPSYQYKPDKNATISLETKYTTSARIAAVLKHSETNEERIVEGSRVIDNGDVTRWLFQVPNISTARGQNGTWTLDSLYVSNVFFDGKPYINNGDTWNSQNSIIWDMEDYGDNISIKVVNDIRISITNTGHAEFTPYGSDTTSTEFKGVFTDSIEGKYSIGGYNITITDYDNHPLNPNYIDIKDAKLVYNHSNTPTWWTNSSSVIETSKENPTIHVVKNSDGTYSTDKSTLQFYYAGDYAPELLLKINDSTTTVAVRQAGNSVKGIIVDSFVSSEKVEWERVDAKFTSLNPSVGSGINVYVSGGGLFSHPNYTTKTNSIDTNNNSINAYCTGSEKNVLRIYYYNNYTSFTKATITIYNAGNFSSAETTLTKSGADNSPKFTFNSGKITAEAQIGANGGGSGNDKLLSASGTSASTITVNKAVGSTTHSFIFELAVSLKINENQ